MSFRIEAKNYRGLVDINWLIPAGLSAIVGANGAGKTTLLFLFDILRRASSRIAGPEPALSAYGTRALRYAGATLNEPVMFGASLGGLRWSFEAFPEGGGIRAYCAERLTKDDRVIFDRPAGRRTVTWNGSEIPTDQRAIIRMLSDAELAEEFSGKPLLDHLSRCRIYYDYDLRAVRQGSEDSSHTWLHWSGQNVFSVLRNWRDKSAEREREEFVIDSLKECFGFFGGLDYERSGSVVEGCLVPRRFPRTPIPAAHTAKGWLTALLHFTAVAGASRGDVIGIDGFENELHPRALERALKAIHAYAEDLGISVVLATQSPSVLDWFDPQPERVFVLDRGLRPGPKPLTDLKTEEWLAHFRLGRVYAEGDFGTETEG